MRKTVFCAAMAFSLASFPALAFEAEFLSASTADLENPHDIKLSRDGRYLFVSDLGNNRVAVLDAETLKMKGTIGEDEQRGPHDVDLDASGRLLVADTHNHRIAIYELDGIEGRLVESLSDGIRKPEGVLAGSEGRVFATGAGSDNLVVFLDGAVRKEIGDLSAPHDVEFAPNRDVWIADAANDRLVRVNQDLGIETILSGDPYGFSGPRYLDVAPDGTLVVADKYSHSVKVIAESGEVIGVIGTGEPGLGPNVFKTPEGVELRGDTVWLSDSGNDRIVKYRLTWD